MDMQLSEKYLMGSDLRDRKSYQPHKPEADIKRATKMPAAHANPPSRASLRSCDNDCLHVSRSTLHLLARAQDDVEC